MDFFFNTYFIQLHLQYLEKYAVVLCIKMNEDPLSFPKVFIFKICEEAARWLSLNITKFT